MGTRPRAGNPTTVGGQRYRSQFEADVARRLIAAGIEPGYEQTRLLYEVPRVYVPDFTLRTANGREILVEAKGYFPPEDRRKMLDVIRAHPERDIRIVLQRPGTRIRESSKTTLARWCDANGIVWAAGEVPEEWLG